VTEEQANKLLEDYTDARDWLSDGYATNRRKAVADFRAAEKALLDALLTAPASITK
jgi:hypothetical protein